MFASAAVNGGTPPSQDLHCLSAKSLAVLMIASDLVNALRELPLADVNHKKRNVVDRVSMSQHYLDKV